MSNDDKYAAATLLSETHLNLTYPIKNESLRRAVAAKDNICPECGSELDTGWECNNRECQYDAREEALACNNVDVLIWLQAKFPPKDGFDPDKAV